MKNNSKSGLSVRRNLFIILAILIFTTIQLIVLKRDDIVSVTANIEDNLEVDVKEVKEDTIEISSVYNREIEQTISRSSTLDREVVQQKEPEINIEDIKKQIEEQSKDTTPTNKPKGISIEEVTISVDMDLTQRCGLTKENFKILMDNLKTDSSGFFGENSDIIYDVCEKYEINEIFFCGLIAGESGWNISANHRRANNYISMMSGGRLIRYNSVEEGLDAAAKLLHEKYLSEDGAFYRGKTLSAVKTIFCPASPTWVNLIYTCMSKIV